MEEGEGVKGGNWGGGGGKVPPRPLEFQRNRNVDDRRGGGGTNQEVLLHFWVSARKEKSSGQLHKFKKGNFQEKNREEGTGFIDSQTTKEKG